MTTLRRQLRRFTAGGILLREVRAIRQELAGLRATGERIAAALEAANAHAWPQRIQPNPDLPAVEVTYADTDYLQEVADIEMHLTRAKGLPPTEEEILAEYERRQDTRVVESFGGDLP